MESQPKQVSFKLIYKGITKRIPLQSNLNDQMSLIVKSFEIQNPVRSLSIAYNIPNQDQMAVTTETDFGKFRSFLLSGNTKGIKFTLSDVSTRPKQSEFNEERIAQIISEGIKNMESSIITSLNDSIMQSRIASMSLIPWEGLIQVDCSVCKRTRDAKFLFYCLEPECKDILICPNCEENGCRHSNEAHLLVKSYHRLNFYNMPKDLGENKLAGKEDKPEDNGNSEKQIEQSSLTDESLDSKFLNDDFPSIECKQGTNCRVLFKVRNCGGKTWPRGCMLVCLGDISQVEGEPHKIKVKINPGKDLNADIELKSQFLETGLYCSFWQMQTDRGKYFGELVELTVKVLL